jgi:threonine/homoserine/homoserine lactone efflux protein
MRQRRWETPDLPPPKRPYRDTVVFHLILAALIVVVAFLTGGSLVRALVIAGIFFVLATAWSFSRWRTRLAELERQKAGRRATGRSGGSR